MMQIPVGKYFALVDDEDYPVLSRLPWESDAQRTDLHRNGQQLIYARLPQNFGRISMHKLVAGTVMVDHINGDGLDNQKMNLRIATQSQNLANAPKRMMFNGKPTSSKFKGVCWDKANHKWVAQITFHGTTTRLGRFTDEVKAAEAYDAKAVECFGEFAQINFP